MGIIVMLWARFVVEYWQSVASLGLPPYSESGSVDFMKVGVFVVVMVRLTLPYGTPLHDLLVLRHIVAYSMRGRMWCGRFLYWLRDKAELGFILISFCYCPMRGLRLGC